MKRLQRVLLIHVHITNETKTNSMAACKRQRCVMVGVRCIHAVLKLISLIVDSANRQQTCVM